MIGVLRAFWDFGFVRFAKWCAEKSSGVSGYLGFWVLVMLMQLVGVFSVAVVVV